MTTLHPIRCGIVGIHGFAREHIDHLSRMGGEGITIAAVVAHQRELDPAYADQLQSNGIRLLPDLPALLAEPDLDLITLPVGIHLHLPFAREVLSAGFACFLEKPAAATLAEGLTLQRLARASDRPLFIGFQDLCHPATHTVKRELMEGAIGTLRRVVVTAALPRGNDYYLRNRWAGSLRCDGLPVNDSPVNNACAHYLALALFLAGDGAMECAWPVAVRGGLWRARSIASCDTASLRIATERGVDVVFTASHVVESAWGPTMRIEGERGVVEADFGQRQIAWRLPGGRQLPVTERMTTCFRQVAQALRGGNALVCTLAQALPHSAAVELMHASLAIDDLPGVCIHRSDTTVVCAGLDALMRESHRRGATLDELGFPGAAT